MAMEATFAFLHHLSAFLLFSALMLELVLLRGELTVESARKILRADMIYGISAGVLLVVGLGRVLHFEPKGAYYYFHNWAFHTKLTLFVLVGLLSIVPTREFLRWRPALRTGQAPAVTPDKIKRMRTVIHVQLTGVVLIMLMAVMMAKGIGL